MPNPKKIKRKSNGIFPKAELHGTATVGTKGQIVIPKKARSAYNIKTGDQLLVFGGRGGVLAVIKAEKIQDVLKQFS